MKDEICGFDSEIKTKDSHKKAEIILIENNSLARPFARQKSSFLNLFIEGLLQIHYSQHIKKKFGVFSVGGGCLRLLHLQQDGGAQGDDTGSTGQHDLAGTGSDDSRLGGGVGSSALGDRDSGVVVARVC